jgi:hypothetical protein
MLPETTTLTHRSFVLSADELMHIDIRPQDALVPVLNLPPSQNPETIKKWGQICGVSWQEERDEHQPHCQ